MDKDGYNVGIEDRETQTGPHGSTVTDVPHR